MHGWMGLCEESTQDTIPWFRRNAWRDIWTTVLFCEPSNARVCFHFMRHFGIITWHHPLALFLFIFITWLILLVGWVGHRIRNIVLTLGKLCCFFAINNRSIFRCGGGQKILSLQFLSFWRRVESRHSWLENCTKIYLHLRQRQALRP